MEYEIVIAQNVLDIITSVNKFIENGWMPQGGICCDNNAYMPYKQAMVRKKTK